jgi:hypothetical protein
MVGVVVLAALAWNEGIKYLIQERLKFNEGSNIYYGGYAVIATLMTIVVFRLLNQ